MTQTLELEVVDWNQSRRASIPEVPVDYTVGELLKEVGEAMALAEATPHHLIHNGQKLNRSMTLEEAGVESGAELTVAPEVMAG